jgi:hypothetical protein
LLVVLFLPPTLVPSDTRSTLYVTIGNPLSPPD